MQACGKVAGGFFVAFGDSPEVLDDIKETFDETALTLVGEIAVPRDLPVCFWRDDGLEPPHAEAFGEAVAVIGFVGKQCFGRDLTGQGLGLGNLMGLAGGLAERWGIAKRIDDDVGFRHHAAMRTANGLVCAVFFCAPAAR